MTAIADGSATLDTSSLELIAEPSFIVDGDRNVTWANSSFMKMFNLKDAEALNKMTCEEICPSQLCGTKDCPVTKASRIHKPVESEAVCRDRNGKITYLSSRAVSLKKQKGSLVTVRDVTPIKEIESHLRQLETDLNVIPTPVMEIDTHFTITYMNPAGAAVAGLASDEVLGKKCFDLFKTPHCKTEKCACARAMKSDSVISDQTIARPREGVIIPIKYTGAPIRDAKGNIKGALEYILDVTDEMREKQQAAEKIENLNTIPTPIMSIDTEFNITFMNPAGAAVAGLTPDEVVGRKCYDLFKTPHCRTEKCACIRAMKSDSVISDQTIARPREGVIIPIKYTGSPIKDAKGNIKGALEYILDVTDEMREKQQAAEKIENLNTIPTPIMSIDTEFNITFMNPAGAAVAGLTPDEVIGKKCYDLFKTPHCRTEKCACTRAMKSDSVISDQTIARPREGVIIPIKYTGSPIKDAKGNVKGALEYILDVTDEMREKQQAAEKIENLNTIPTPIMSIDTEFNITFMNPAGAAVAGLTPDEVIGKKCYDLFKTPHCRTEKCACSRAMKSDSVISDQTIARPRDGVIMPIKYTGSPIKDAKGNIKGALEYVLDITEEAKQRQEANEKIENLNAIPNPIYAVDTDHTITYINPAGAAMVGLSVEETIGRKCYELFKSDRCQTDKCGTLRAMRTNKVIDEQTVAHIQGRDFSVNVTSIAIKDAKGNIKGGLEYIVDRTAQAEVERLIGDASDEVAQLVKNSLEQMEKADSSTGQMKELIDQEVIQMEESSHKVESMLVSAQTMLEMAGDSSVMAREVATEAEAGKKAGSDAGRKMQNINQSMQDSNKMVGNLVSQLEKIGGFVDIIKEIASQTNLLAFNAAIEAARAGDAGRGFAVVADEVRKLAEKSSRSAVDIAGIVKQVEGESHQTISAMQDGMKMLDAGGEVINTALESMDRISTGIISITDAIENLNVKAAGLVNDGEEVKEQLQTVVKSSRHSTEAVQMVDSSIAETVTALEQLANSSKALEEAIRNLG